MPDCSNSFSFPIKLLPQAWGSSLVCCLFMKNTINRDSLRRRPTLKHNSVKGRNTIAARLEGEERVGVSRLNLWRRDTAKGSGLTHCSFTVIYKTAAPPLRSPPVCLCLLGFLSFCQLPPAGFACYKLEKYFIWELSETFLSIPPQNQALVWRSWEAFVKRWRLSRLATPRDSNRSSSPMIAWLISK